MEIFGNAEYIKKVIEERYNLKIKELEKERDKSLEELRIKFENEIKLLRIQMKNKKETEVKKVYSMIFNEEKLKAKKEFEEKRNSLIESVFKEAKKRAKDFVHSKAYIEYIKKNMPKEKVEIIGDSDYYRKFFPKLKIDKSLIGIIFKSKNIVYDFTLDNIINSKKDILRHELSKILFG